MIFTAILLPTIPRGTVLYRGVDITHSWVGCLGCQLLIQRLSHPC